MAKKSRRERLIEDAESFAAGCSRSRLELRLVDEIRKLEAELARVRADSLADANHKDTYYRALLTKNYKEYREGELWVETGSLTELLRQTQKTPVRFEACHLYEVWTPWAEVNLDRLS